jgi:hypothetical protein
VVRHSASNRHFSPADKFPIDINTGLIKRDRVLLQDMDIGAFFVGFGRRDVLRNQITKAEQLVKQYNPDQSRDENGRWTISAGVAAAISAANRLAPVSGAMIGAVGGQRVLPKIPSILGELSPALLEGLGDLAATFAAPVAFLGMYFFPFGRSAVASGTLPDHPDINYHYDSDTGHFSLYTDDHQVLFTGVAGGDGLIRTEQGDVVGRRVDGSVIVNTDELGRVLAAQTDDADSETAAVAIAQAQAKTDDPKLCPDPEPDVPGNKSPRSIAYQQFINTFVNPEHPIPPGFSVYYFNPVGEKYVSLDDCDQDDGDPVEAKGYGFAKMLNNSIVEPFLAMRFLKQANNQVDATQGLNLRWYVAEPETASYLRKLFSTPKLSKIQIINLPAPMLKIMFWQRHFFRRMGIATGGDGYEF